MDYKLILEAIAAPTFMLDTNHTVIAWNRACEAFTGVLAKDIVGTQNAGKVLYGHDRPCLADIVLNNEIDYIGKLYIAHSKAKLHNGSRAENWHDNINGRRRYLIADAAPIHDENGNLIAAIESLEDATEAKALEDRLLLSDKVFTYTKQAILITDANHRIIQCNQAFETLTGYTLNDVQRKTTHIFASGKHDQDFYDDMQQQLDKTGHWEGEIWDKTKTGKLYVKWLTIDQVLHQKTDKVAFYISIFYDITEQKKAQDEIQHLAFHDALTGLPNRLLLQETLETNLKQAKRHGTKLAVLFIDLDGFKAVNDTFGHQAGDELLIEFAARIQKNLREVDTVARLSGDEFVAVVCEMLITKHITYIVEKLLHVLSEPYLGDRNVKVTPSIGVALYPENSNSVAGLLEQADKAMYQVKNKGKNAYLFAPENQASEE